MDLKDIVKSLAYEGKDYNEIVTTLNGYAGIRSDEEIELATRKIDDYIVNYQLAKQEKSKAFSILLVGIILFLIGLAITLTTYFNSSRQYILAYGLILGGIWNMINGYKIYTKPIEKLIPQKRMFKR